MSEWAQILLKQTTMGAGNGEEKEDKKHMHKGSVFLHTDDHVLAKYKLSENSSCTSYHT